MIVGTIRYAVLLRGISFAFMSLNDHFAQQHAQRYLPGRMLPRSRWQFPNEEHAALACAGVTSPSSTAAASRLAMS